MSDDTAGVAGGPNVGKFLDLSTGHLPQRWGVRADEGGDGLSNAPGVSANILPYGWLMWVPDDPDQYAEDEEGGVPPQEILVIQRYARKHGCDYVLFDRDADQVDDLPSWVW